MDENEMTGLWKAGYACRVVLPTVRELRESGELSRLVARYWCAVDDGGAGTAEDARRYRELVQVVFDDGFESEAPAGACAPVDGWFDVAFGILLDRSKAGAVLASVRRAGINAARDERRYLDVRRRAAEAMASDPTQGSERHLEEDLVVESLREALLKLDADDREFALTYYRPGGDVELQRRDLERSPFVQKGPRRGEVRSAEDAALAVQKRIQRIRDDIAKDIYEQTGIERGSRAKARRRDRGGGA